MDTLIRGDLVNIPAKAVMEAAAADFGPTSCAIAVGSYYSRFGQLLPTKHYISVTVLVLVDEEDFS